MLSFIFASVLVASSCWIPKGPMESYGSFEQLADLAAYEVQECPAVAFTWTLTALPKRRSVILWDHGAQTIYRVHLGPAPNEIRWERWTGASPEAVRGDDPSDGFDLPGYTTGQGAPPLTAPMRALVEEHGGTTYAVLR